MDYSTDMDVKEESVREFYGKYVFSAAGSRTSTAQLEQISARRFLSVTCLNIPFVAM